MSHSNSSQYVLKMQLPSSPMSDFVAELGCGNGHSVPAGLQLKREKNHVLVQTVPIVSVT